MIEHHDLETVLRRVLGPGRPELSCVECFEELDRYVEAELAGVDADAQIPGLKAHLEGCPACAEDHANLLALVGNEGRAHEGAPQ